MRMFTQDDQKASKPVRGKAAAMAAALIFVLLSCAVAGCQSAEVDAQNAATPEAAAPTPQPEVVAFSLETAESTMTPPPPTFTPTPAPTEVPFSYYAPTINMSFEELVGGTSDFGELGSKNVNWPEAYPPADTYKIVVDVYWQVVMIYTKDANGEYTVPVRYMLCSTGDPGIEDGGETRRGTFNMLVPRVRFGHFLSGEAAQYWSLIRSRTYFHSILYDKQDKMSTYQVETYKALGSKDSHGCIRLTVPDARWIWYNIAYGTVCEIRDGSKDDTATGEIKRQLVLPAPPSKQETITAGKTPYTDNWTIDTLLSAFDPAKLVPFKNEKQPPPAMKADDEVVEDPNATPGPNDPSVTDPGTTDPGATDPGTTDPGTTDPGTTDPGTGDSGSGDAGSSDSGSTGDLQFATGTS